MSTFEVPELNVTSSLTTGSIDYTSGVSLNVATKTTSTLPLNPVTGQLVFNTDDNRPRLWTGSAWKVLGLRESVGVYTDATRPSGAGLEIGTLIFNTDEETGQLWNGDDWVNMGGSSTDVTDVTNILASGSPRAIAYIAMPSGPRTFLNYITSFGVNQNSSNNNNSNWNNSYSGRIPILAEPLSNVSYFNSNGGVKFISGDGSADGQDWAVIGWGPNNNGDYDGYYQDNSRGRYMGGENTSSGGGANGVRTMKLWGFGDDGWVLLYQHAAGQRDGNHTHNNSNWWNNGGTTTSGNGKRSAYDTVPISYIGFSAQ